MIFDCNFWAVVKVENNHASDGSVQDRDIFSYFEGMWDTKESALAWAEGQSPKAGPSQLDVQYKWDYTTEVYVVVPCSGVKASCLSDLELKIEASAKLRAVGIGVELAQI